MIRMTLHHPNVKQCFFYHTMFNISSLVVFIVIAIIPYVTNAWWNTYLLQLVK